METGPVEVMERGGLAADLRDRGYATCAIPWDEVGPSDVFSRFDALQENAFAPGGLASYRQVDELLVKRGGETPLLSTSPVARLYYAADGLVGYGHTYFVGTLQAVRQHCSVPPPLEALWETVEIAIASADRVLRTELSPLPGVDSLPSCVRIWKYIYNDLPWVTPPHYDLTVISAVLATVNPGEELLTIGLEGNGAPIKMVRERATDLKRFTPTPDQFSIVLPGIYSNRWGLEPTWHYVRALDHPGACRYSLVWSLIHPPYQPVRPTRHIQDEAAPNEVMWT
jgi:hypothetical protein